MRGWGKCRSRCSGPPRIRTTSRSTPTKPPSGGCLPSCPARITPPFWRRGERSGEPHRHRVPLLRAELRHSGGSHHRLDSLRADALLGFQAGPGRAVGSPGLRAWRVNALPPRGRRGVSHRIGGGVPPRHYLGRSVKPALDRHPCLMGRRSRRQVSAVPPRQPALGPDSRSRNQHISRHWPPPRPVRLTVSGQPLPPRDDVVWGAGGSSPGLPPGHWRLSACCIATCNNATLGNSDCW